MKEKIKQLETTEEKEKQNKKMKIIEKSIKTFGGIIIAILGVIFLIFCKEETLSDAISYCVATVLLIFGLFSVCLSFLLGKGIISFDVIGGCVVAAFGILIYTNSKILQDTLPVLIGATLLFLSLTLIVDTILSYKNKIVKRAVCYTIADIILVALGITILVLKFTKKDTFGNIFINVIIGVSFILFGISYIVFTFLYTKFIKEKEKDIVEDISVETKENENKEEVIAIETKEVVEVEENKKKSKKKKNKEESKEKEEANE